MKEKDKLLIDQVRGGSERAFTQLYNKYKQTIWFTAYNIVKNKDIADDLTSVVFTKIYEKINTYIDHISFEMWIKTITINSAIDYIRRTKNEKLNNYIDDEESTIQLEGSTRSPEDDMILNQDLSIVMEHIPLLRKKYRDLINARIADKSYRQISEELAISEDDVKVGLNLARRKLRQLLPNIHK